MQQNLEKGFSSQLSEFTLSTMEIDGTIPKWLSGTFLSIGPAQFEIGKTLFNHWFDGFSMLKSFNFKEGKVTFQNRFLQSHQYMESKILKHLYSSEFGTYAKSSLKFLWKRAFLYDNCNINTTSLSNHFIAMTETPNTIEFNLEDLTTLGNFHFEDTLRGHLQLAHPQIDKETGEIINVLTEIGYTPQYHIYKISPGTTKRKIIHTYRSNTLFYMHSFSITQNYVILFKSPIFINKYKLLLGLPFNNTLSYQKKKSSFFIIIDKRNGSVHEVETEPFVCLHSANAYEKEGLLRLDLICYDEETNPYSYLYLSNLRSQQPNCSDSNLRCYVIDISSKRSNFSVLTNHKSEFPRINSSKNGSEYNFVYTCFMTTPDQKFYNALQKINVHTGKIQTWEKKEYYVGEPVFIKKPDDQKEDGGVIVSIVFNSSKQISSLIILDACTMEQHTEIYLPFYLPFGLHGNFYSI